MVFDKTDVLKKSNLGAKLFLPKNDNRSHFWAILGPAYIGETKCKAEVRLNENNDPSKSYFNQ